MADEEKTIVRDIRSITNPDGEGKPREEPYLIVLSGGPVGMMYRILAEGPTIIGRAIDADVRLEDEGVSRNHAQILYPNETGNPIVEDLNSTNGTFVNGEQIRRHELQDGDKVQIGSTSILKFSYQDDLERTFQQELYTRGVKDGLTGIYNKKYFLDRIEAEYSHARRHEGHLTLLIFDIDHFKRVNDTFGHPAGDHVLIELSKVVLETLRTEDVFARYGGEEFVILMRDVDDEGATVLSERIRHNVEAHTFVHSGTVIPLTISIGVGSLSDDISEAEELIHVADKYLYKAKNAGRNRVEGRSVRTV